MSDLNSTTSSIRIDRNVPMQTRDGTILKADVYRPDDGQKHPAILNRTPYNKIMMAERDTSLFNVVQAGYAFVFQDIRGRYASQGYYDGGDAFLSQESPDGADAVEWVALQPWCDGNVGTYGGSYMARVQWLMAKEKPPHLKAMAPSVSSNTPANQATVWYGVISLIMGASSAATVGMDIADKLGKQGKDVSRIQQLLGQVVSNPEQALNYLPLKDMPHFNYPGVKEVWYNRGLQGLPPPELAEKLIWDYKNVTVPCLHQSGWYDFNEWGALENFRSMKEMGGSQLARKAQHLLLGPWVHGQMTSTLGEINFGPLADVRGAGVADYNIAFFNKYLRGMDINLPAVRYFVMGRNTWHNADDWPLPQTRWQRYFLHSRGRANSAGGDGLLSRDDPGNEPPDTYIYDPHKPVRTTGGAWAAGNGFVAGPLDQSHIEQRKDVLCFTTPELKEDMEVTGPLELPLFAATSARDTDFTAKLVDVYPDGYCYNVADGIIRARFRKSVFHPEPVQPGELYEYIINMVATSQLFRKGHRIRIDISSSNFPAFDRNMNTGNAIGEDARGIPATQSIFHEARYPSFLDLPVIGT
jgi:putative CocE/NonD family hydrolase